MENDPFNQLITSLCDSSGKTRDDWLNLAKLVKSSEEKGKESMNSLRELLAKDDYILKHPMVIDVIDYLMDSSPLFFQVQLSSKAFMTAMLMLLKKGNEYQRIQLKVLFLLEKWAKAFESKSDLVPNFNETYRALLKSGCVFPVNMSSEYMKYVGDTKSLKSEKEFKGVLNESDLILSTERSRKYLENHPNKPKNNYGNVRLDLTPANYPKHLRLFVSEMPNLLEYVALDNEMIDAFDYSKKKIDEGIVELTQTIQDISVNIKKLIESKITHEKLLGICLGLLQDLDELFARYDCLTKHQKPKEFISCFMHEYSCYNLNINQGNNMNAIHKMLHKNQSSSDNESSGEDDDDNNNELIK